MDDIQSLELEKSSESIDSDCLLNSSSKLTDPLEDLSSSSSSTATFPTSDRASTPSTDLPVDGTRDDDDEESSSASHLVVPGSEDDTFIWRLLMKTTVLASQLLSFLLLAWLKVSALFSSSARTALNHRHRLKSALVGGATPSMLDKLERALSQSQSYQEWCRHAIELDLLEGAHRWKAEPRSSLYSWTLIGERLAVLRESRRSNEPLTMATTLRSGLLRNLGGMGNPELFSQCRFGTKHLIADYIGEVVRQLEYIEATDVASFPLMSKFEFFHQTRQAFGRTALLLSGGAGLGMYHFGVVKALWEEGLLPKVISGASVGALIGSLVCATPDAQLAHIFEPGAMRLAAFEKRPRGAMLRRLKRLLRKGVLMDVRTLEATIRENVGDVTFLEAFRLTGRSMHVSVNSPNEPPRLLNYLTSPHVLMWSAATASCALTGLYEPVELMAKCPLTGVIRPYHPSKLVWTDGSVQTDLPMLRLAELMNVNHFIVSQVNPHVVPFLDPEHADSMSRLNRRESLGRRTVDAGEQQQQRHERHQARVAAGSVGSGLGHACVAALTSTATWLIRTAKYLVTSELRHRVNQLCSLGLLPSALSPIHSLLNQPYTGHVTIVPRVGLRDYALLLSNPTEERRQECIRAGELATWPRIAFIKAHCSIELALDLCVERCRRKMKIDSKKTAAVDAELLSRRCPSFSELESLGVP